MSDVDRKPGLLERLAEATCSSSSARGYLQCPRSSSSIRSSSHSSSVHVSRTCSSRQALTIAKEVADGHACRDISAVRSMFEEQVGWAVEAGVDYVVGETFTWGEEALLGLEVIKATGLPAVITLAVHRDGTTGEGWTPEETCKRLEDAGADVVGVNCIRGPKTMFPLLARIRERVSSRSRRCPCRTARPRPSRRSSHSPIRPATSFRAGGLPERARPVRVQPLRARGLRAQGTCTRGLVPRRLLRGGPTPHPGCRRGPRPDPAGEPVLAGHVEACVSGVGRADPAGVQRVRRQAVARCLRSRAEASRFDGARLRAALA